MPFQPGHKLSAKPRLFDSALRRAIAQDDSERIRQAAEKLLDCAAAGEPWAINQLADRLDGKAQQNVTVEHVDDVSNLSFTQLAAQLAASIAGGSREAVQSTNEPSELH